MKKLQKIDLQAKYIRGFHGNLKCYIGLTYFCTLSLLVLTCSEG